MPSLTVKNETSDQVRIVIYTHRVEQPSLDTVAWQILSPPPNGQTVVAVPSPFEIYVDYETGSGPQLKSNTLLFEESTAAFRVTPVSSPDKRAEGAELELVSDGLVLDQVLVKNEYGTAVEGHIQKSALDFVAPEVIPPGGTWIVDLRGGFFVQIVGDVVQSGDRIVEEVLQSAEVPIEVGQTATVTGSLREGYSISVG